MVGVNTAVIDAELRLFKAFTVSSGHSSFTDEALGAFGGNMVDEQVLCKRLTSLLNVGVAVDPKALKALECCDWNFVMKFTKSAEQCYGINPDSLNSTFWKSMQQVENMSELEFRLNQLMHYASTYGEGYYGTAGQVYEPDRLDDNMYVDLRRFTIITFLSESELENKILSMLKSGMALSQSNIQDLLTLIKACEMKVDYEQIKNGEVQAALLANTPADRWPYKNFELVTRGLVYLVTNGAYSQVVKKDQVFLGQLAECLQRMDDETNERFQNILGDELNLNWDYLVKYIRPYKKIYLIFKQAAIANTKHLINQLMRKNKKLHQPAKQNPLNHIRDLTQEQFKQEIKKAQPGKMMTILNYANERLYGRASKATRMITYPIRNGKTWVKELNADQIKSVNLVDKIDLLTKEFKCRYGQNFANAELYIPKFAHYALPTSQKQMVGAIPVGSSFQYQDQDIIIGVNWHQNDLDLDLHAFTLSGHELGWNQDFRSEENSLVYSGDMTNTNQSGNAAEYFKISKNLKEPVMLVLDNFTYGGTVSFDLLIDRASEAEFHSQGSEKQIIRSVSKLAVYTKGCQQSLDEQVLAIVVPSSNYKLTVYVTNCRLRATMASDMDSLMKDFFDAKLFQYQHATTFSQLAEGLGAKVLDQKPEGLDLFHHTVRLLFPMDLKQDTWTSFFKNSGD